MQGKVQLFSNLTQQKNHSVNSSSKINGKIKGVRSHAVTGNLSSGLKSRPGNYSFTLVALWSSIWVIGCCKFREDKAAGRNASESLLASLTNWGCWLSGLKGKTDTTCLTINVSMYQCINVSMQYQWGQSRLFCQILLYSTMFQQITTIKHGPTPTIWRSRSTSACHTAW